jgi:hypothetical protein
MLAYLPLEARPMKSDKPFHGEGRAWVPPTVTKLAIGTETKSPVAINQVAELGLSGSDIKNAEPRPPATPASKFGFSLEWAFPLSVRAD